MHYLDWHPLNEERKEAYEEFMQGCREAYGNKGYLCDSNEKDRIDMTLRQPQSMVNFTDTGFMKIKAPKELRELLTKHWEINQDKRSKENWPKANIYTNHWKAPTYMVSVEDSNFLATKSNTDYCLSLLFRASPTGAILSPHVDRLPLVSSCIVNVAQDVDEDWPLEVIDRQGHAVNVTMEPGELSFSVAAVLSVIGFACWTNQAID
jgi:prolyl 4-hydroxylase